MIGIKDGELVLYRGPDWLPAHKVGWRNCTVCSSPGEAQGLAIALTRTQNVVTHITAKRIRKPPEAYLRWLIQHQKGGNLRFDSDPTNVNGWTWQVMGKPAKMLSFSTKEAAERWLVMYRMATGTDRGRVIPVPIEYAERVWGTDNGRTV